MPVIIFLTLQGVPQVKCTIEGIPFLKIKERDKPELFKRKLFYNQGKHRIKRIK